jgi:putative membrane protein
VTDDIPPEPAKPAHAAKQLVKSADKLATSAEQQTDSADRRTVLAADRTVLAAERTYAWVRTGLAAMAAGIGARALLDKLVPDWMIAGTGSVLILFSAFCFIAAIWREFSPGVPPPKPDTAKLPGWLLILVNGFLVMVSIAALAGLWLA